METTPHKGKFLEQLQTLYSIESKLVEAMPQMIESSGNLGLRKSLALHFAETTQHKAAIGLICKQLDLVLNMESSDSQLDKILERGRRDMDATDGNQRDSAIISAAMEIEMYELAAYKPAAEMAEALGYKGIAQRLNLTFEEERQASSKLQFLEMQLKKEIEMPEPELHVH